MGMETFTEGEFSPRLKRQVKRLIYESDAVPSDAPRAYLLGGQSGAGKTALHGICLRSFEGGGIVINGDEYRSTHPRFMQLDKKYGAEAVAYTAVWAGKMTEALIDVLSAAGYNLVVEGTLRTSQVPMDTAKLLMEKGYSVSLALMAVKPEMSLISCKIRYEQMRLNGQIPRATDPAHHEKIIKEIVGNLAVLEDSGLFDEIRLYSRAKKLLHPVGDGRTAAEALQEVLFGEWNEEDRGHYAYLEKELARLTAL